MVSFIPQADIENIHKMPPDESPRRRSDCLVRCIQMVSPGGGGITIAQGKPHL